MGVSHTQQAAPTGKNEAFRGYNSAGDQRQLPLPRGAWLRSMYMGAFPKVPVLDVTQA